MACRDQCGRAGQRSTAGEQRSDWNGERAIGPFRPVRGPPAHPRCAGAGRLARAVARPAGNRWAGGQDRGLADGPAGMAGSGQAGRRGRLRAHPASQPPAGRGRRTYLLPRRSAVGRPVARPDRGTGQGPGPPGAGPRRTALPRVRAAGRPDLDQPSRLSGARCAAGGGRPARGALPRQLRRRPAPPAGAGVGPRRAGARLPALAGHGRRADRRAGPGRDRRGGVARRSTLVHEWRKFLFSDPGLPAPLLPAQWPGHEAADLFHAESARLLPAASRFVDCCLRADML
jgi:PaaX-like protein C-terminal domain